MTSHSGKEERMVESKRRKRRIQMSGGGIPGLLVVGGAFVIAALVANHSSKRKANNKNHQELPTSPSEKLKSKDGGGSDRLLSILETPPAPEESHLCCRISIEQCVPANNDSKEEIDAHASLEPEAVKTIIVEKILDLEINGVCILEEQEHFCDSSDIEIVSVKGEKESCIHEEQEIFCANSEIKNLSITGEKESYIHEEQEIICTNSEVEMPSVADEVNTTPDELPLSKFEGFLSSNMDMGLLVDANANKENYCEFVSSKEVATVIAEGGNLSETFDALKENLSGQLEEVDHSEDNIDHSEGPVSTEATTIIGKCEFHGIKSDVDTVVEETQTVRVQLTDRVGNPDGEKFSGINNDMVLEQTQTEQLIERDGNVDKDSNYDGDYDNDVDDDEEDKGEGSEGTGDSSVDLNAEAIWPAESLGQDSSVLKDVKFGLHALGQKLNEASNEVEEELTVFKAASCIKKNFGLRSKHPPSLMLSRTSLGLWLVLMVGLLLLLFVQQSSVFQHLHNPPLSTL